MREVARGEFFRDLGTPVLSLQNDDLIFPVMEIEIGYKAPARYDDLLDIELWINRMSRAKIDVGFVIRRISDNALILQGRTLHVCTSVDEKVKRMPLELAQ